MKTQEMQQLKRRIELSEANQAAQKNLEIVQAKLLEKTTNNLGTEIWANSFAIATVGLGGTNGYFPGSHSLQQDKVRELLINLAKQETLRLREEFKSI